MIHFSELASLLRQRLQTKLSHAVSRVRGLRSPLGNQSPSPLRPQTQHSAIPRALLHLPTCSMFQYTRWDKDSAVCSARATRAHKITTRKPTRGRTHRRRQDNKKERRAAEIQSVDAPCLPPDHTQLYRSKTSQLVYVTQNPGPATNSNTEKWSTNFRQREVAG
jgi:hypothetical protein